MGMRFIISLNRSPRVGNLEFSLYVETLNIRDKYRITHSRDIVIHIPPARFGYKHINQEVWYHSDESDYIV